MGPAPSPSATAASSPPGKTSPDRHARHSALQTASCCLASSTCTRTPAPADWKYGMDADADVLPRGTTTMLSQGDAGAAVWDAYYEDIVAPARARILMAISPAVPGRIGAPGGFRGGWKMSTRTPVSRL